ncbi:MAG: YdeI/OmpD-associated family protein, partial [Candidatus Izemoplasmatales bacterium]|nr:YdeI/OmpD-associated family protein [Candidatus Izemoplasmatales bacterium]
SGFAQIDLAKQDGRWEKCDSLPEDFSIDDFKLLLHVNHKALQNYLSMSPSIQKTYAISYYYLKKAESRKKRLTTIIERLLENKPPM